MKKKRTFLVALAMVLVCILSITGTLAFLQANTSTVTNTFIAAGGPGPFVDVDEKTGEKKFEIKEYDVTKATSGLYTLVKTTEVAGLKYDDVMPGTTLPKQAFVKLSRTATVKTTTVEGEVTATETIAPAPAYLFLEVIDELPEAYSWAIDDTNWEEIAVEGRDIYLYVGDKADANHVITSIAAFDAEMINIIKDNQVTVAKNAELDADPVTLSFNAYLAQASVGSSDAPVDVFTACFGK